MILPGVVAAARPGAPVFRAAGEGGPDDCTSRCNEAQKTCERACAFLLFALGAGGIVAPWLTLGFVTGWIVGSGEDPYTQCMNGCKAGAESCRRGCGTSGGGPNI